MDSKSLLESKTFWVNILALAAMVAQSVTGHEVINAESQVALLGIVNVILRLVTSKPVAW